jgi:hypothetical protein
MPRKKISRIDTQFVPRTVDMIRSPAFSALSLSAHRVIARLEIEHCDHGGCENGKLPVTYDDFERFGINRHAIGPAIRECVALGFVEVTEKGRAGNAEWRKASLYRLTYLHTATAAPTHSWRQIKSQEQAEAGAAAARKAAAQRPVLNSGSEAASTFPKKLEVQ